MSPDDPYLDDPKPARTQPGTTAAVMTALLILLIAFVGVFYLLRPRPTPPPPEIASDPLLTRGREVFLERCVSCHGLEGRGDGPISATLPDPKPRDLLGQAWKYGDQPDQVLQTIARGTPGLAMSGFKTVLDPQDIVAVASYVYTLAGRPVPKDYRVPATR